MPNLTEEQLSEFAQWGTTAVWEGNEQELAAELVRLARLGLWAEEHGARALDFIIEESNSEEASWNCAVRARNALPTALKDSAQPATGE